MPVLESPPDPLMVARLKGTLDFYVWRGLFVCRTWPRNRRVPRSTAEIASAQDFGDTASALSQIPLNYIQDAQSITQGTRWTWRDLWTSAIYNSLWFEAGSAPTTEAPMLPPYFSPQWYTSPLVDAATGTASLATGTARCTAFPVPTITTFDRISWEVTATTGGNDRLAIYGPITTDPRLAPLVWDSGNQAIGSTGVKTVTISLELTPGWYLICLQNSVTRTYRTFASTAQLPVLGSPNNGNNRLADRIDLVQAYGAFPDPLTTAAAFTQNVANPIIYLRAA